ncbi:MAG TPA: adenylate/guanylate cyclase domain-containing protein, partial [Casimicrobiaceae bacterium]|nr:adenylate/guanylate cyclase domain-containing protein [Casimicrobiaceae bacterium]
MPDIALVFTDIEGSTRLWEQHPTRMRHAVARHYELTRTVFERHEGSIDTTTGDGALAVFRDAIEAVRAAVELQLALSEEAGALGVPLRLRCAVHVARDERDGQIFFGQEANRASRIMGAAHGGQILVSAVVADAVRDRLPGDLGLADCGLLRLRDLSATEHVYQVTHAALPRDFPALRGLAAIPNNIPQQLTRLIDREADRNRLYDLLDQNRLITLMGTGGIGKTRLALQVAADALDRFADGVWVIDLSPLSDASLLSNTIASTLAVRPDPSESIADTVCTHLRSRNALLLLDTCEHVIDAAADFVQRVLNVPPHVKVLCTSREPLRIEGEVTYPLAPLAVPPAGKAVDLAEVIACDGVQCFVEWARRAQPSFQVTAENAGAVAEICRRLDGIPLAIELAAARVSSLPIQTIASRLKDRFALLTRGSRTALPRQQTLRALIGWSYDLLSPAEQTAFRRVGVFAGSFSLEAAEAVAGDSDLPAHDVLDAVTSLVDKSLLVLDQESGRFRLLDTLREFAREKLGQSAEAMRLRERLVVFAVEFSARAREGLVGPEQGMWMKQLDLERDNLVLAQSACDDIGS